MLRLSYVGVKHFQHAERAVLTRCVLSVLLFVIPRMMPTRAYDAEDCGPDARMTSPGDSGFRAPHRVDDGGPLGGTQVNCQLASVGLIA